MINEKRRKIYILPSLYYYYITPSGDINYEQIEQDGINLEKNIYEDAQP